MFNGKYSGTRVLVTGHTGFKGSWLSAWLLKLGASVGGFSNSVPTSPSNYEVLNLRNDIENFQGDVRNRPQLTAAIREFKPEIIFHLAAQSLVRVSYEDPVSTFETNAIGTMNVLECVRAQNSIKACVLITSDKCYQNVGWMWGYRENDVLGGEDPYSASKGCAEIIAHSYMKSYFPREGKGSLVTTTRAGNVIGGGDWAADRIVPDCIRAWSKGETVTIRSPGATRPWQHVLEPLGGYLWLGAQLLEGKRRFSGESFNFGPQATVNQSVEKLIKELAQFWGNAAYLIQETPFSGKEASLLKLSCDKALGMLGWSAVLSFDDTLRFTAEWYRAFYGNGSLMNEITNRQIDDYCALALAAQQEWVR